MTGGLLVALLAFALFAGRPDRPEATETLGALADPYDVFDLADRISVMLQGKLGGTVSKSDVTMDDVLGMIIIGKLPHEASSDERGQLH